MIFSNKLVELKPDIFVYKNFLNSEECDKYVDELKSISDDQWRDFPNASYSMPRISDHEIFTKKIQDLVLDKEIIVADFGGFVKMKQGQFWGLHADDHDFRDIIKKSLEYVEGTEFELEKLSQWGIVIYFNDFEGGQLNYPEYNFTYQPQKGDLVIHSAKEHCRHEVLPLISKNRYSASGHMYSYVKVPKNGDL